MRKTPLRETPVRVRPPKSNFSPRPNRYLPKLGPAFKKIALNWELEYKPACIEQAVERVAPFIRTKVDLQRVKKRCTSLEDDALKKAAMWKPAEVELEWNWEEKVFDVFLSHKITDAKDIVLSW